MTGLFVVFVPVTIVAAGCAGSCFDWSFEDIATSAVCLTADSQQAGLVMKALYNSVSYR